MSQISSIFGSDDDNEILSALYMIANVSTLHWIPTLWTDPRMKSTSGLGLIHESQNIFNYEEFTRPWFAWANRYVPFYWFSAPFAQPWNTRSYFAEMMLDLAVRKPGLIFKNNESYYPGQPSVSKKKYYAFWWIIWMSSLRTENGVVGANCSVLSHYSLGSKPKRAWELFGLFSRLIPFNPSFYPSCHLIRIKSARSLWLLWKRSVLARVLSQTIGTNLRHPETSPK